MEHSQDAFHGNEISINAEEALEYLTDLADDEPDNPEVFYQLAKVHYQAGNHSKSLSNIRKAIALEQDYAEYHFMQGMIYQKLNKPEAAVQAMLLAESLGNSGQELYQVIAEEYMRLGESKKAREAIERLTGKNAETFTLKGNIFLALGDTTLALTNFTDAIAENKQYVPAYNALTDIYIARGEDGKAASMIAELISLEPTNISHYEKKGNLYQRNGELDSAMFIFKRIAAQRGSYMDYYKISNIFYLQNSYDSARIYAARAFEGNSEFLEAQLLVARSLDKRRRYNEALEVYESIVQADSTFNLAVAELENLKRKVAYLWRLEQQRKSRDSAINSAPPPVQKKDLQDNRK